MFFGFICMTISVKHDQKKWTLPMKDKNYPTYHREEALMERDGFSCVVGIDEAGRGPGAGPVVAAAASIPKNLVRSLTGRVNDSKQMTQKQREKLYGILATSSTYGVGVIDNETIDRINILEATKRAMEMALSRIPQADYVLIDGNMTFHTLEIPYESIVKGDALCLSIAAGGIIAKVTRDRIMIRLHEEYPMYGWKKNKGYLSAEHIAAIKKYGPSPYHRLSFNKVGRDDPR
jgi:ribonuclease HII